MPVLESSGNMHIYNDPPHAEDLAQGGIFKDGEVPTADGLCSGTLSVVNHRRGTATHARVTLVRVTHCGVLHVVDLSRMEWLRVAAGRSIGAVQCRRCLQDLPLPVSRADARTEVRAAVSSALRRWRARIRATLAQWLLDPPWYVLLLLLQFPAVLGAAAAELYCRHRAIPEVERFWLWLFGAGGGVLLLSIVWGLLRWRHLRRRRRERAADALAGRGQ